MTILTSRRWWSRAAGAAVLVVACSARGFASPILAPSISSLAGGLFEYDYTLTNATGSAETLFDLGLFFSASETVTNVLAPVGWTFFPVGPGFVDWLSLDVSADLLPGASLSGFSFQSRLGPGSIAFQTTGYPVGGDPFSASQPVNGLTLGPTETPAPVPEPGTLWLLGSALALLAAIARPTPVAVRVACMR